MAINITRKEDIMLKFCDGYAKTEVLKDAYPLVRTYKCLLKAGYTVEPEIYSDKIQVFSFTSGTGYICGKKKAYNIDELSFYIPDFDREKFSFYAAEDMEITLWVVDMLESDKAAYEDTHMVLPSFKRFSECEPYDQSCKGPHTKSWTVIAAVSYTHLAGEAGYASIFGSGIFRRQVFCRRIRLLGHQQQGYRRAEGSGKGFHQLVIFRPGRTEDRGGRL